MKEWRYMMNTDASFQHSALIKTRNEQMYLKNAVRPSSGVHRLGEYVTKSTQLFWRLVVEQHQINQSHPADLVLCLPNIKLPCVPQCFIAEYIRITFL